MADSKTDTGKTYTGKTYTGGCHCGQVRFECTTDMAVVGCADFAGWKVIQVRTQMDAADEVEAGA